LPSNVGHARYVIEQRRQTAIIGGHPCGKLGVRITQQVGGFGTGKTRFHDRRADFLCPTPVRALFVRHDLRCVFFAIQTL